MKKLALLALFCCLLILPAQAGLLNVSGRASFYTPSDAGASTSMMYGLSAAYPLTDHLSVRGAVDTTTYTSTAGQTTFTPISVDLIYSESLTSLLTAYAGAGGSYNSKTVNGAKSETAGVQAEAGIRFSLAGLSAGFEYRYLIPDASKLNQGSTAFTGYATGSFSQSFIL